MSRRVDGQFVRAGLRGLSFALLFALVTARVLAQHPIPESVRWATITHPGNEPYRVVSPTGGAPDRFVGRVDHEYQISRTEVTGAEWFEFVQAYAPYVPEHAVNSSIFTSRWIGIAGYRQYFLPPENANLPVDIGWHFAARYANWLHNGKALTPEAFESGAYDTSTFGQHPGGGWTDQITHSAGATYWIPSVDEWIKSAHFDPNRYGEGMPGYWLASNSSDTPPVRGAPGAGGETSARGSFGFAAFPLPDVASYPATRSPWGLLDTSGGFSEWTEDVQHSMFSVGYARRRVQGSSWLDLNISLDLDYEFIDGFRSVSPVGSISLRFARAVPGALSTGVFVCAVPLFFRRRRQSHDTLHFIPERSHRVHAGRP